MTNDHIVAVAAYYLAWLDDQHFKPCKLPEVEKPKDRTRFSNFELLDHTAWMCDKLIEFVLTDELDKANRWLGFVQGVLCCTGCFTIDRMREHNRSMEGVPDDPKKR